MDTLCKFFITETVKTSRFEMKITNLSNVNIVPYSNNIRCSRLGNVYLFLVLKLK